MKTIVILVVVFIVAVPAYEEDYGEDFPRCIPLQTFKKPCERCDCPASGLKQDATLCWATCDIVPYIYYHT